MMLIFAWLKGFSLRQYAEAIAVVALFVFVMYWDHLKIQQGRDEVLAAEAKANAAAQTIADNAAAIANAQIHSNIDAITANLPDYLRAYGDKSKATDCPSVPYLRKIGSKAR